MPRTARYLLLAVGLAAAGFVAYTAGRWAAPPPDRAATVLDTPQDAAGLELTRARDATRVRLGDLADDAAWTLVFFGFVDCPDVCPLTMARLAETYRDLGEPDDLQVVMVTVDPERDGPERLRAYVEGFHPDFEGLTGSSQDVATAARTFFIGYNDAAGAIVHTEAVGLVDDEGRLRGVYGQGSLGGIGDDLVDLLAGGRL